MHNQKLLYFHEYVRDGNVKEVKRLIKEEADINDECETKGWFEGGTPLNIAIHNDYEDIAELLRQHDGHE